VGLGKSAVPAPERQYVASLRDELETALLTISGTRINGNRNDGPREHRLYNTTNIYFENCDSDALTMDLDGMVPPAHPPVLTHRTYCSRWA